MSQRVWGAAVAIGLVAAAGWVWLGYALRDECDASDPGCDDWVVADAIATGVAVVALAAWLATGSRSRALLGVATAALAVPLVHVLGI